MRSTELQAALDAAKAAAEIIGTYYRHDVRVQMKEDQSPVTEADVCAEKAIRAILSERFPSYGFYGEETGRHATDAQNVWLVDPIDGTKSFVRECPFFSTQIALLRKGKLVLGVSSAPACGELAWAQEGEGASLEESRLEGSRLDGSRIHVSAVSELHSAIISTGNLKTLAASNRWDKFGGLIQRVNRIRGYGDFVHYHLLARGSLDVVIESDVNILDIAALTVIVREAGGTFTDLQGRPIGLDTTSVLAASNLALHAAVLQTLTR